MSDRCHACEQSTSGRCAKHGGGVIVHDPLGGDPLIGELEAQIERDLGPIIDRALQPLKDECEKAGRALDAARAECETLRKENDRLMSELEDTRDERDDAHGDVERLEVEICAARADCATLTAKLDDVCEMLERVVPFAMPEVHRGPDTAAWLDAMEPIARAWPEAEISADIASLLRVGGRLIEDGERGERKEGDR